MMAAELKERLRGDLKAAMRERKTADVSVIRTVIAAIDNAGAVPVEEMAERLGGREDIGEVARRELDAAALGEILESEIAARLSAAADYERLGLDGDAARLRDEADLIERYRA